MFTFFVLIYEMYAQRAHMKNDAQNLIIIIITSFDASACSLQRGRNAARVSTCGISQTHEHVDKGKKLPKPSILTSNIQFLDRAFSC